MGLPALHIQPGTPRSVSCPVCAGACARISLHSPSAYWRCSDCRTVHLHPQPSAQFLEEFYEAFHRSSEDGGLFSDFEDRTAADFPAKARIVCRHLGWTGRNGAAAPRVLDVGCGKGFFVRELARWGLRAEGIDISRVAIQEGCRMGLTGLHAGRLEDHADWAGSFNAVTAWATIEHLPDARSFLRALQRMLKPGGLLFLDTGLAGDAVDRWAPGLIQWYDVPQHLFVYSRAGMLRLLHDAGFELLSFDPNFERTPWRRIIKFTRNRALAFGATCLCRLALGRTAYARMRLETKWPFGSLLFVVARRSRNP